MANARIILDRPDRAYELKWCDRAEARLASLDRPPTFADLRHRRRSFYAMCAILWAGIIERNHRFVDPEELAEYLSGEDRQLAAVAAIREMIEESFPPEEAQKKTGLSANSAAPTDSIGGHLP